MVRVQSRTLVFTPGTNEFYDVQLELSNRGISQVGGGNPGVFPHVGCTADSMGLVQFGLAAGAGGPVNLVLGAAPIPDNTLLYVFIGHGFDAATTRPPTTGTWDLIGEYGLADSLSVGLYSRIVEVGDTDTWVCGLGLNSRGLMAEFSGSLTFDTDTSRIVPHSDVDTISIIPTAGRTALLVSVVKTESASGGGTGFSLDPVSGMTLIYGGSTAQGPPSMGVNFRVIPTTSGSYTVGSTGTTNPYELQIVVAAAFNCSDVDEPPMPGQWVYGEIVTPAPDGSITTFSTAFPFADGSLTVYVDNLDQTAAVSSYDGAARTFIVSFAPWGTDVVKVDYQGR